MVSTGTDSGTMSLSDKLYALAAERLKEHGESLPCTLDAMHVFAQSPRAELDYLQLINLDNRSLVDACYAISFYFPPPDHYIDQWKEDIENLSKDEFHKKFMNSFVHLPDFGKKHVRLRNCICLDMPAKFRQSPGVRLRIWIYSTFKPMYMRLPVATRQRLKKLLWNRFFVR